LKLWERRSDVKNECEKRGKVFNPKSKIQDPRINTRTTPDNYKNLFNRLGLFFLDPGSWILDPFMDKKSPG
jgi:hypothetical protein